MVFTLWGENWNKDTTCVRIVEGAHVNINTHFLGTFIMWKYLWVARYLFLGDRLRALHGKKLARVIVCANTGIEFSWCRNAKHTRTPPTQYQAQFLTDQYQPTTSSRFFYAHVSTSNSLFLLPFYVADGCTRSLCRSAVGPRDHGPGGAKFPSGWHHHCADHDVMWLVVRSSRGSGRLVSCAVCSGE